MTYCVAMSLDAGMIFASDSRTNAGVDQIARFSKMRVFDEGRRAGDRDAVLGQPVDHAERAHRCSSSASAPATSEMHSGTRQSMFDVARLLGDALREVKTPRRRRTSCRTTSTLAPTSSSAARSAASRRACSTSTARATSSRPRRTRRYFQIGETKYGKPIIDRVINARHDADATRPSACWCRSTRRCARTSRSACRSTSLVYERDALRVKLQRRIDETDPYFQMVHTQWGEGLRRVFAQLPDPDWA